MQSIATVWCSVVLGNWVLTKYTNSNCKSGNKPMLGQQKIMLPHSNCPTSWNGEEPVTHARVRSSFSQPSKSQSSQPLEWKHGQSIWHAQFLEPPVAFAVTIICCLCKREGCSGVAHVPDQKTCHWNRSRLWKSAPAQLLWMDLWECCVSFLPHTSKSIFLPNTRHQRQRGCNTWINDSL